MWDYGYDTSPFKGYEIRKATVEYGITSIGKYAFCGCRGLTELTLPSSVTSIGWSAFEGCSGLTELTLPKSVTSIGSSAFEGCTGLTELTLPSSITSIGEYAFKGCSGLTELTLPSSITSIGEYAFEDCTGLTELTLPNSVTSIWNGAFRGCTGLTELTLPSSVTSIGKYAFKGCRGLTELTLPSSVTSIGDSAFAYCSGLTELTLPNSVTSIGEHTFEGCSGLTELTLPDRLESIREYAFSGCSGLTELTLPNSITSIRNAAFSGCSGLTELTLPDRLESIREYAFSGCTGLVKITSLAEIPPVCGSNVFYGVDKTNCELIVPEGSVAAYKQTKVWSEFRNIMGFVAFGRCGDSIIWTLDDSGNLTLSGSGEMWNYSYDVLPFKNYGIKKVTIGCGIASIGNAAFSGCTGLEKITSLAEIPPVCGREVFDGVNKTNCELIVPEGSVAAYKQARGWKEFSNIRGVVAFGHCGDSITWTLYESGNLTLSGSGEMWNYSYYVPFFKDYVIKTVTIGDGITSIGDAVFEGCSGLTELTLPNSVTSIGSGAFEGCTGLEKITVGSENSRYDSRDNCNSIIETETNTLIVGCKNSIIPNSVTSIGYSAFRGCSGLTELTLPSSVTSIGNFAFAYCSGLTELTLPSSVTSIGNSAFCGCSGLTELILPNSVTSIGGGAFSGCTGLEKITSLAEIPPVCGYGVFDGVTIISCRLIVPGESVAAYKQAEVWREFKIITAATGRCGDSITWTLDDSGNLTLSGSGEMWDYNKNDLPFKDSGIKTVTIKDGITSIGDYAFAYCSSGLTELTLPNSITSIGDYAFAYCSGLAKITSLAEIPPVCGFKVFNGVNKTNCELIVPEGSVAAYKQAEVWNEFSNISGFSGVEDTVADGNTIRAIGNQIEIIGYFTSVEVYGINGALIYKGKDNVVTVPSAGIYLVHVADKTRKIVVE